MSKNLNTVKKNLIDKVSENYQFFYTNASLNSFVSKIVKSNRYNKLDEYEEILDYIIDNNLIYKSSEFNDIVNDIKLTAELETQRKTKTINFSYQQFQKSPFFDLQKQIQKAIIKLKNKYPSNLLKVTANYPNDESLNDSIEPNKLKKIKKSILNYDIFWMLHKDSDSYNVQEYFIDKSNRVTNIKITINSYPTIQGYSMASHHRAIQNFRDSGVELLCVPTAITNYFKNKIDTYIEEKKETKEKLSKDTLKKYYQFIHKIKHPKFNKPYNIENLTKLSDELKISFTITDFINENIHVGVNGGKKYNITLINTKLNHIEYYNNNEIEIPERHVNELLNRLPNYIRNGSKIYTKNETYSIEQSDFSKTHAEHMDKYNIYRNYIKADSSESEYINNYCMSVHHIFNKDLFENYKNEISKIMTENGNHITTNCDLDFGLDVDVSVCEDDILTRIHRKENELFKEIDLIKAYYNLTNKSPYGVPSNSFIYYDDGYATEIEQHIENKLVGFYTIDIYDIDVYEIQKKIDKIFGNNRQNIVLTTPQVMILKKNIPDDFRITSCIIAPSIPFKFDESALKEDKPELKQTNVNKDEDDNNKTVINKAKKSLKHFCKSVGIMMTDNFYNKKYIKTENPYEFIKLIDNKKENVVLTIDDNNIIEVRENTNKTLRHIGYFIHSFTSSEVMNFIFSNNDDDILGVKLDSIIVKKQATVTYDESLYKVKEANIYNLIKLDGGHCKSYITSEKYTNNCESKFFGNDEQLYKRMVNLEGPGGSGKSSDVKKNFEAFEVTYGALAWARGADFKTNYNCQITSLNKLIGDKCERIKLNEFCKVIALDENTMINNKIIRQVSQDYPDKRILIIGDIDEDGFNFQCSLSTDLIEDFELFNPKYYDCQTIKYTINYRFDKELNDKLNDLRVFMKDNKDKPNRITLLNEYVNNNFKECFVDKSEIKFNKGDIGISAHQESKLNFKYTKYFISKGSQPVYYNTKTIIDKNIIRGDFSYDKPKHNNYETKLFNTVHAAQGTTVPINSNLLIIIESNFDYQLWYTSLSRAKSLSQIKIITGF